MPESRGQEVSRGQKRQQEQHCHLVPPCLPHRGFAPHVPHLSRGQVPGGRSKGSRDPQVRSGSPGRERAAAHGRGHQDRPGLAARTGTSVCSPGCVPGAWASRRCHGCCCCCCHAVGDTATARRGRDASLHPSTHLPAPPVPLCPTGTGHCTLPQLDAPPESPTQPQLPGKGTAFKQRGQLLLLKV